MPDFDLVIRNALVGTAADTFRCDIGVRAGKIAALASAITSGTRIIDAGGKLVLPGGVDGHCHLDQPMGDGSQMADDFATGTVSAAFGGTTTVIPFAAQAKGQTLRMAVDDYHKRATGKAVIDYAFHLIISDTSEQVLGQDLPALIKDGYTSFKIYMTYDDMKLNDRQILDVLALARREQAMVMIHAENTDCITWLTEKLELAGKTAPIFHAHSRPMLVEREATHRAISLAELLDVPILIVHVSGREAIEQIRWAQGRGLKIYGETCPQYLLLSSEDMEGPEGAKCVCSPPPRDKDNQRYVWDGLANGVFHILSSDHAPFKFSDPKGKFVAGKDAPFRKIPNGIPGIETRLPLLFSEGVGKKRITLQDFVALTAANPARLYGLYPRKGTIAIGSDADLVIWDTQKRVTITNDILHHNVDYTPYEGIEVTGWPETVISRGYVVVEDGILRATPGRGKFLPCELPDPALPKGKPIVDLPKF
jgi:dihydropyrimidinase